MLHDILLQTKCYNLKMLLKHNVINTVCYRQKNVTARMIQLQKKFIFILFDIYTGMAAIPVVQNVIMKMRIAETEKKM